MSYSETLELVNFLSRGIVRASRMFQPRVRSVEEPKPAVIQMTQAQVVVGSEASIKFAKWKAHKAESMGLSIVDFEKWRWRQEKNRRLKVLAKGVRHPKGSKC